MIAEHLDPAKTVVIINKSDMEQKLDVEQAKDLANGAETIITSLAEDGGAELIEKVIKERVLRGDTVQEESALVTNARHTNLLKEAVGSVNDALVLVEQKEPVEIIEIDVNQAYESLGEIIGESVGDDIIDEVFSRFCLGK